MAALKQFLLILVFVGALVAPSQAAVLVYSDFSTHSDGWGILGNSWTDVRHEQKGPEGYLSSFSENPAWLWYYQAPVKFRGEQSVAYGGFLDFDLALDRTHVYDGMPHLILQSRGRTYGYSFAGLDSDWRTYSVGLDETAGWRAWTPVGGWRDPVSSGEMAAALTHLDNLLIRGEYESGANAARLDNVMYREAVQVVPEPGAVALLGVGLLALIPWVRRRRPD